MPSQHPNTQRSVDADAFPLVRRPSEAQLNIRDTLRLTAPESVVVRTVAVAATMTEAQAQAAVYDARRAMVIARTNLEEAQRVLATIRLRSVKL